MDSELLPQPGGDFPDVPAPAGGPGLRVLVAEDDADLAAGLAAWLRLHGHRVRVTADGPAALRAAAADPPDVLLLDLGLPGMDGFGVAERVRREVAPAGPKAPLVIAVTGRGGAEDRRRSREAGIDLHLTKPLDEGLLLRVLRRFRRIIG
jgi:two-component system, OmpR family, response regulator